MQGRAPPAGAAPRAHDLIVFGGVFDPVHIGHLRLAEHALRTLPPPHLSFLPAGLPPHKAGTTVTAGEHRLQMLRLAIGSRHDMSVDPRELRRAGPSYTVLTLQELQDEHPGRRVLFLIGADNVTSVGRWYRAERIFELCDPVIVPRPGYEARFEESDVPFLTESRRAALNGLALKSEELGISSSDVRRRAGLGESLDGYVPTEVERYIVSQGLYREQGTRP